MGILVSAGARQCRMDYELCQRRHAAHHMDWSNGAKALQTRQRAAALQQSIPTFTQSSGRKQMLTRFEQTSTPLHLGKLPQTRGNEPPLLGRSRNSAHRGGKRSATVPLMSREGTPQYIAANWWDTTAEDSAGGKAPRPGSKESEVNMEPGHWGQNHLPDKCDTLRLVGKADRILARERGEQAWEEQYADPFSRTIPGYGRGREMTPRAIRGLTPRQPFAANDHLWDIRDGLSRHNQIMTDKFGSTHSTQNSLYGGTFSPSMEAVAVSEEVLERRRQRMKPTMAAPAHSCIPADSGHRHLLDARVGVAIRRTHELKRTATGGLKKWNKTGNVSDNLRHGTYSGPYDPSKPRALANFRSTAGASQFPNALKSMNE